MRVEASLEIEEGKDSEADINGSSISIRLMNLTIIMLND
jgi:hypothetical protein